MHSAIVAPPLSGRRPAPTENTQLTRVIALFGDILLAFGGSAYLVSSFTDAQAVSWASSLSNSLLLANGFISLFGVMYCIRRKFPLLGVFFCFNWMFLAVAPLQQIGFGNWDPVFRRDDLVLEAVQICLVFNLAGLAFALSRRTQDPLTARNTGFLSRTLMTTQNTSPLLVTTAIVAAGLLAFYGHVLFTNREAFSQVLEDEGASKGSAILVRSFLQPFVFVASLTGLLISFRQKKSIWIAFAVVFVAAFLVNNPMVQARYKSSTLIVFAILTVFGVTRVRVVIWFIVAGVAASPIYNSLFRSSTEGSDVRHFSQYFVHMDFDALDIFCYTILWVHHRGLEWGGNILSSFLFFIPRSIWESKSLHLAAIIYSYLHTQAGFQTDNLSSPPPAEGYLSFGAPGAIIFSILVVWFINQVERRGLNAERYSPLHLFLCLSPMLMVILLRGALQIGVSQWAIHFATVVATAGLLQVGSSRRSAISRSNVTASPTSTA